MDKQRVASGISGGIFLICLGILLLTGWWWPGIMFAIGLSSGAELVFRGKIMRGIGTMAFFCAIPFAIWIIQAVNIPWVLIGPMILIGIGVIILVKTLFLRE
ncbi:MAG: hypothetical protein GY832_29845 [Chloroflexi bacterium]|nr:hypothetical protein [Chloroflexota bacterium]